MIVQNRPARVLKVEKPYRLCRKHRRGAALVEFAIVFPILIVLFLAMIEFGRLIMVQQILTNASREGARMAVMDGVTASEVTALMDQYCESAGIAGVDVTIDPADPGSAGSGEPVTVTASVLFDQVTWLPTPMFLGGDRRSASAVMRRETTEN